jgi:hypothetical protein
MSPTTMVVAAVGLAGSTHRGGAPSMPPLTTVVAAAGLIGNTPQGDRHRCLI